MKKNLHLTIAFLSLGFYHANSQTTLIDNTVSTSPNGSFQNGTNTFAANGWTVANGATNQWFVGTQSSCVGTKGAYIGTASGNNNYTATVFDVSHFYRDVIFPAGEPNITLSFKWKAQGESCCDYLQVFLVPTSTTPVGGTQLFAGQIGSNLNLNVGCPTVTFSLPCATAGTTQRLVFSWKNDASIGTNPAGTIDDILLTSSPISPSCSSVLGTGVVNVPSLPYASGAGTTCGAVNDLTSANVASCGSTSYLTGEDQVFVFTPTASGCISINLTSSGSWTGIMLYDGCPITTVCSGTPGTCMGYSQSSAGNQSISGMSVTAGQTYYLILDSYASPTCNAYSNLTISAPSAGPTNDVPCSPTALTLGTGAAGTNVCAGAASNPGSMPACFIAGTSNTVFYTFVAPASGSASITLTPGTITSGQFGVYSGACGSLSLIAGTNCSTASTPLCLSGLTVGATYTIMVDGQSNNQGTFTLLVTNPASVTCTSLLGTGVTTVGSLPYASGVGTTCGSVDDLTTANMVACGSSSYFGGEDQVWVFTPTSSGQVTISVTSAGSYMGLTLYNGCPITTACAGTTGTCIAFSQSFLGNQSFCTNVVAGTTYYLVMDSWPAPTCNAYSNLTISAPSGVPAGTICATAPSITLPYTAIGHTTACYGNDYTNASTGSCGTLYESGEDRVYAYTATGAECIGIFLTNGTTTNLGFQVYQGCPGSGGTTCIASYGGGGSPTGGSVTLPGAGTYYIVVDTWSTPFNADYDISVTSYGTGPVNDPQCSATTLTLGASAIGDNTCSSGAGEPAVPACWTGGNTNTIWYKVTTTSTTLKVRTYLTGTLTNTQIAVYSGACGSLTLVAGACNDDVPVCGTAGSNYYSELSLTGLTTATTYYIRVDGANSLTGSFTIMAIDGGSSFPLIAGMDCMTPNPVCLQSFVVADPGYNGYGSVCDLPTSYCLASSERNVVWYSIPINANGNLSFDIVPNDFNPLTSTSTDYDFAVWKIVGAGAVTCAQIAAGTATPLRCNYSGLGVTGLNAATGNAPGSLPASICPTCGAYNPSPFYDASYEPRLGVNNGDTYLLAVSNFSSSVSGFGIDFLTSPIGYTGSSATSVTWSGGTNTAWNLASNWNGCTFPTCGIDAIIAPAAISPVVVGNMSVKDLTINVGATLTLAPACTLTVCGSITNNGTITASPTSTIIFTDNLTTHTMNGSLSGANKLGNLVLTDLAGSTNMTVTLNTNLDLGGSFTTTTATSIFNTTGKIIKVAGNFMNNNGATTFTSVGVTGSLEFNGSGAQIYNQGTSLLDLNFVIMNHTGTGVTLQTDMNIKTVTGTLTLTLGKIITTAAYQVYVKNKTTTACNAGNTSSYVEGFLRRGINGTGVFEFPVGESVKLYQRATINFTTAPTTIDNIRGEFVQYGATPPALGTIDCTVPYNLPFLNNGKWNLNAYDASMVQVTGNGIYNITIWPRVGSYTNGASAVEWTVAKDPGSGWAIVGTCNLASVINQVMRNAMTGFSAFGVEQSTTTLPVELVQFAGEKMEKNHLLNWQTASEINNQWFILEQSTNGIDFTEIYRAAGQSNSNTNINYSFTYKFPDPGLNYYRLRQVNTDGTFTFSDMVVLDNTSGVVTLANLFPNPSNGDMQFDLITSEAGSFSIEIYDITGKIVMQKKHYQEEGKKTVTLETSQLSTGVYTLKVFGNDSNFKSINRIVRN